MSNRSTRPEHRARNPMRTIEAFDAPREYEINGNKFLLVAPNDVRTTTTIKNHTQDYPILFNKLREMIKDDNAINKDAEGLPVVHFHKYTELLLNTFNELGIKWRTSDKLWIKNPEMITSVPYVKIYPEKQVGTAKSGKNYDKLRENTIREASSLATPAASLPAPPTMATVAAPPAAPTPARRPKSRDYPLGYSTKIIAVKKNTNDRKKSLFVVDDKQNCIFDFQKWKEQTHDYANNIPEPGPVGFIKGPNMPEPLLNWSRDRDASFINGESQRDLPNIYNDRGQEIGGLFVYLELNTGFEVEFFPEPEPEEEEISVKRITYSKNRFDTTRTPRTAKTYLKETNSNSDGNYGIYADDEEQTEIGEMDDDGDIMFSYNGYDSEDDRNTSNYPYEILTTYQVDENQLKKNKELQKESKRLHDANLGIRSMGMGGFWEVEWSDTWNAPYYFNTTITDDEGDNATEKHFNELHFYENGQKNPRKFLTQRMIDAHWTVAYSNRKMAHYYANSRTGVSQYTIPTDAQSPLSGGSSGGKRKTKKKRK